MFQIPRLDSFEHTHEEYYVEANHTLRNPVFPALQRLLSVFRGNVDSLPFVQ